MYVKPPLPARIVSFRLALCRKCPTPCAQAATINHADPCAECPLTPRRWTQYGRCKTYGLGDLVAAVAQPIAGVIDRVAGTQIKSCGGCAKRREMLNRVQL